MVSVMISKKTRVTLKRVLSVFIPAVLVFAVGVAALDFYFIHRLTHPPRTELYGSPKDFQLILQKPMWFDEKWKNSDSTQTVGWLLSQGKPAPSVILSHGYASNRSELLTLSFELWKAGYNVLVYDLRGHGESPVKWSGLGTYERDDLLSAIKFLRSKKTEAGQELMDGRIGLYGVDLGGYVSLVASSQDPAIKAVAVDSVYPDVSHFMNHQLKTMIGGDSNLANRLADSKWTNQLNDFAMQLYLMRREDSAPAVESVAAASGRKFLFIVGKNSGALGQMTQDLHELAKDPKQIVEVERSRLGRLYDKTSSEYDARVVAFFKEAIPTTSDKPGQSARVK
jgi:pimeloyl-ACP methyl ester carboxylesterase